MEMESDVNNRFSWIKVIWINCVLVEIQRTCMMSIWDLFKYYFPRKLSNYKMKLAPFEMCSYPS